MLFFLMSDGREAIDIWGIWLRRNSIEDRFGLSLGVMFLWFAAVLCIIIGGHIGIGMALGILL